MDELEYNIVLMSYYPDNASKGARKGNFLGGVSRGTKKILLETAKMDARGIWVEWVKKYPGSMVQIWIHPSDVYPPRVGPSGAVFYADNFKHFKSGTKQAEGTPF